MMPVDININSVLELQRWWVLKSKMFGQKSTNLKKIIIFCEYNKGQIVKN